MKTELQTFTAVYGKTTLSEQIENVQQQFAAWQKVSRGIVILSHSISFCPTQFAIYESRGTAVAYEAATVLSILYKKSKK